MNKFVICCWSYDPPGYDYKTIETELSREQVVEEFANDVARSRCGFGRSSCTILGHDFYRWQLQNPPEILTLDEWFAENSPVVTDQVVS